MHKRMTQYVGRITKKGNTVHGHALPAVGFSEAWQLRTNPRRPGAFAKSIWYVLSVLVQQRSQHYLLWQLHFSYISHITF